MMSFLGYSPRNGILNKECEIDLPEFFKDVTLVDKNGHTYRPDSESAKVMYYRYKMMEKKGRK